jgi:16S rRNA (uracil1498-N3)-methyltransferase
LSGPEGGLSTGEVEAAQARGFVPVSLGPRILRAETAPLAALAKLLQD